MSGRRRRRPREEDDFGKEATVTYNEQAMKQAALLEAMMEQQAQLIAKQQLRQQAKELLESVSSTVKSLERQLDLSDDNMRQQRQRLQQKQPDVTEITPPRHPRKLKKSKRTTINLDDLEALSELAPGTSLAELLVGLKQQNPSSRQIRPSRSSRHPSASLSSFHNASNPNFGSLAQISEDDYKERWYQESSNNRQYSQPNNDDSYEDDVAETRRERNRGQSRDQHQNNLLLWNEGKLGMRRQRRPQSAGRSRGGYHKKVGKGTKGSRGRRRRRRPISAGRNRTQVSSRLSPPPISPRFIEPTEKSMKYQLALNAMQKGDPTFDGYDEIDDLHVTKKKKNKKKFRPKSAPLGGRIKKKTHGEIMSKVEEEVARKEIDALSHAPLTHNEKVKKLHRYNWNQEQTKLRMGMILPPLNIEGTLGKHGRPCSASRIQQLSKPREYRQTQKLGKRENAPFFTNGGQGLLAKLAYVPGLGNGGSSEAEFLQGHQHLNRIRDASHFSPNRRFLKMVTRGGNTIAQKLYNYKLEHLPEYNELKEGETLISIMSCSGCKKHQKTTRHNEMKFQSCALKIEAAILEEMPNTKIVHKKVGNRLIGALEVQMCKRIRNRFEKKLLHSRIITGTFPSAKVIVKKALAFMPEHLIRVNVTTSMSNNSEAPLLSAKRVDKIIDSFTNLIVTLVPEEIEDGSTNNQSIKSNLVEDGFEPEVQRKKMLVPSAAPPSTSAFSFDSPTKQEKNVTTINSSTSLMVSPGKYLLTVAEDRSNDDDDGQINSSLFIPIREHINLTETTELDVTRTICRKRSFIIRFVKSALNILKSNNSNKNNCSVIYCEIKDLVSNKVDTVKVTSSNTVVYQPKEHACTKKVEICLVNENKEKLTGVCNFDEESLKKIEESFLTVE